MIQINSLSNQDITQLLELAKQFHQESYYKGESFDEAKLVRVLEACNKVPERISIFLQKDGDTIVGGILGHVSERYFSHDKIAGDYAMFFLPSHRDGKTFLRVFKEFENWAKANGASKMVLGHTTQINMEKAPSFYKRLGFDLQGYLFSKELK